MDIENIQYVLQGSPRLNFEYTVPVEDLGAVVNEVYTVDYESRTAAVVSNFYQYGFSTVITTIYKDGRARHHYNGMAEDDEIAMSGEAYNAMFEPGGALYPVNFGNMENSAANGMGIEFNVLTKSELRADFTGNSGKVTMMLNIL